MMGKLPTAKPAGNVRVVLATPEALTAALTAGRPPTEKVTVPSLTVPPLGLVTVALSVTCCVPAAENVAPAALTVVCVLAERMASVPLTAAVEDPKLTVLLALVASATARRRP
jgi:hypothetical protein